MRSDKERHRRLCELNVLEQAANVVKTTVVQDAWKKRKRVQVHAWVYDIHDGMLKQLVTGLDGEDQARQLRSQVTGPVSAENPRARTGDHPAVIT